MHLNTTHGNIYVAFVLYLPFHGKLSVSMPDAKHVSNFTVLQNILWLSNSLSSPISFRSIIVTCTLFSSNRMSKVKSIDIFPNTSQGTHWVGKENCSMSCRLETQGYNENQEFGINHLFLLLPQTATPTHSYYTSLVIIPLSWSFHLLVWIT